MDTKLKRGATLQGGKYVIEETLGSGTGDVTILSNECDKGKINGHEYVDLGLSVKWATCNVGANNPTEYGNYYAWGETSVKSEYTYYNDRTHGRSMKDIGGKSSYDVARANWGRSWRLPNWFEFKELIDNCESEWTTINGVNGRKFTSKRNGKSIFFPAAGRRDESSLIYAGKIGYYWSSMPDQFDTTLAYNLWFNDLHRDIYWNCRSDGQSVRPVQNKAKRANLFNWFIRHFE